MRIFISHGQDKTVAGEMKFLADLARALERKDKSGPAHTVLLDRKRIDPGANWTGVLHDMLAECQAAILLLSPRAIGSDWVLKEVTVLAYRKALDKDFPIFPVLIGGLKPEQLDGKGFSPLCLGAIQVLNGIDQPKAIAAAVKRELGMIGGAAPLTPLDCLAQDLGTWIAKASNTAELETLCEDLYGQPVQWLPQYGRAEQRARVIARGFVRERDPPVPLLRQLIKRLHRSAGLDRDAAETVLTLASPLWVNPNAAAQLAEVAGRNRAGTDVPPRGISVALDASLLQFTPDRYARRVLLPTTDAEVVCGVAGGGSDGLDQELPARVRAAYRRRMSLDSLSDAEVDRRMAAIGTPLADASAVFFVIPAPMPDAELLKTLQTTFPRVTFILQNDGRAAAELPPGVQALAPPLDPDIELDLYDDDHAARNAISRR